MKLQEKSIKKLNNLFYDKWREILVEARAKKGCYLRSQKTALKNFGLYLTKYEIEIRLGRYSEGGICLRYPPLREMHLFLNQDIAEKILFFGMP
jgi:hypothetical protein